jgi:hypothetical protein
MVVGAMLMVYQQFSGINVVIFYAKTVRSKCVGFFLPSVYGAHSIEPDL